MIRWLLLLACCLLVKCGGISYTQPDGVKCGEKVTLQWEYSTSTMNTLKDGDELTIELWHDASGIFNDLLGDIGKVKFPVQSFEWTVPKSLPVAWEEVYATSGNYASYFRIRSADDDFNNDPFFNWAEWRFTECEAVELEKIDCKVSDWGPFTPCDPNCGPNGRKTHARTITTNPKNGGEPCPVLSESVKCTGLPDCEIPPVDCVMSDWSDWSKCDSLCDKGSQLRSRSIVTPAEGAGVPCATNVKQTQQCDGAVINANQCQGKKGCDNCECRDDFSCDEPLECIQATRTCVTAAEKEASGSTPGTLNQPCDNGACTVPLSCVQGRCIDVGCISGLEGCPCDSQRCRTGLACNADDVCVSSSSVTAPTNGGGGGGQEMPLTPIGTEESSSGLDFSDTTTIVAFAVGGCVLLVCCIAAAVVICLCVLGDGGRGRSDSVMAYNGMAMTQSSFEVAPPPSVGGYQTGSYSDGNSTQPSQALY